MSPVFRDRSCITGRGEGYNNTGGVGASFTPTKKKGGRAGRWSKMVLVVVGTTGFEVILTQEIEVLAILKRGAKSFQPFKRGGGGAQKL